MTPIHTACAFWQWVKRLFVRSRHPATTNPTLKDSPMTLPTEILDDLAKRFRHVVTTAEDVIASHSTVATIIEDAAKSLLESIPAGREASLVLTKLEEAASWAHAAVARNPVAAVAPVAVADVVAAPVDVPVDVAPAAPVDVPVVPVDVVPAGVTPVAPVAAPVGPEVPVVLDATATATATAEAPVAPVVEAPPEAVVAPEPTPPVPVPESQPVDATGVGVEPTPNGPAPALPRNPG